MQKRGQQAILFDMDGTLIDTIEDIQNAINGALASQNISPITQDQTKKVVGKGLRNALKGALAFHLQDLDEHVFESTYQLMISLYHEHYADYSHPYEGIENLLKKMLADGYRLGILSNKEDALTQRIIKKVLPDIDFIWVSGMKVGEPRKPDKYGVRQFCKVVNLAPEDVMYIGDSEVDYHTAKNAGCPILLVSWGFREKEVLHTLSDAVIVDSVRELEDAIYAIQREGLEKQG